MSITTKETEKFNCSRPAHHNFDSAAEELRYSNTGTLEHWNTVRHRSTHGMPYNAEQQYHNLTMVPLKHRNT